jgi:hypothetical protein
MLSHANLPQGMASSPQPHHYPSPMSSQTSQTGATGPNTTPLMSNRSVPSSAPQKVAQPTKRRRGSAVTNLTMKEDEDALVAGKVPKQSPRMSISGRGPGGPPGKRMRNDS